MSQNELKVVKPLALNKIKKLCRSGLVIKDFEFYQNQKMFPAFLKSEYGKMTYKHFLTRVIEAVNNEASKSEDNLLIYIMTIYHKGEIVYSFSIGTGDSDGWKYDDYKSIDDCKVDALRKYLELMG